MTDRQIEISDKILKIFVENNGDIDEGRLFNLMFELGYPRDETRNILIMLIEDFNLLRRNVGNVKVKHLIDKGYAASRTGIKIHLQNRKRTDFINGYTFKILQFIIPTSIAIFALFCKGNENIKNNYYNKEQIDLMIRNEEKKVNNINSDTVQSKNNIQDTCDLANTNNK